MTISSNWQANSLILMYHSITRLLSDPWSLSVTPEHFGEHIEVLRKRMCTVQLEDLLKGDVERRISSGSVVITFDDGYANNLRNARPLLERYGVPATIFLATGYLDSEQEFWWDELERLLLQPGDLPERLQLSVNGTSHTWELGAGAEYSEQLCNQHRFWRAWEKPPTARHSLYVSVWQLLQCLPEGERQSLLRDLRAWANKTSKRRETHRPLSFEELLELARGDIIKIGCHTVTHSRLSTLSVAAQRDEIWRSKRDLEDVAGRTITSFAYPYGNTRDYTIDTVRLVREAGFNCACSTTPTAVTNDSNHFELPRLQVQDWDGDEFSRQLSLWSKA